MTSADPAARIDTAHRTGRNNSSADALPDASPDGERPRDHHECRARREHDHHEHHERHRSSVLLNHRTVEPIKHRVVYRRRTDRQNWKISSAITRTTVIAVRISVRSMLAA